MGQYGSQKHRHPFYLIVEALFVCGTISSPLDLTLAKPVTPSIGCNFTSPINADCNFDWRLDADMQRADMRDIAQQNLLYKPSYVPVSSPGRAGKKPPTRRQGEIVCRFEGLFGELNSWFTKALITITANANQAYIKPEVKQYLRTNYSDYGPVPPNGFGYCEPSVYPYSYCDATSGERYIDPDPTQNPWPEMSDDDNIDRPDASAKLSTIVALGDGTATWHHAPNGNIYVVNSVLYQDDALEVIKARTFAGNAPFITSGSSGRVLHAYADTLNAYGVSRLRLSHAESMPSGSLPIALVPAASPALSDSVLIAADTSSNVYYPVTCAYNRTFSKIFIVKSYEDGIKKLTDPSLQSTVTGGPVKKCRAVPYTNGAGPV